MKMRTTIELDQELVARAKRALGAKTTRATVEEALRRAVDQADGERAERAANQLRFLIGLPTLVDTDVLAAEDMWR